MASLSDDIVYYDEDSFLNYIADCFDKKLNHVLECEKQNIKIEFIYETDIYEEHFNAIIRQNGEELESFRLSRDRDISDISLSCCFSDPNRWCFDTVASYIAIFFPFCDIKEPDV